MRWVPLIRAQHPAACALLGCRLYLAADDQANATFRHGDDGEAILPLPYAALSGGQWRRQLAAWVETVHAYGDGGGLCWGLHAPAPRGAAE